ncbi:MAG: hypothetical protein FWC46_08455 [Actinomycetia bacterium]|nr:hypothetical protein [Actinomycetes bacterium]
MPESLMRSGDVLDVTVDKVLPFGVLVATKDGTHGLVRGAGGAVGDAIRVRVDEYDTAQSRFSATAI